jgi:hypothetical protein
MAQRGRPAGQMTHRRRQVLEAYADATAEGRRISWAELARKTGLHSYNDARRIVRDLHRLGAIKSIGQTRA